MSEKEQAAEAREIQTIRRALSGLVEPRKSRGEFVDWGDEANEALDALSVRLAQAEQERDEAIEKLHRCRADFHAKVLGKNRSVYRGGEPPSDLPDDWVGT